MKKVKAGAERNGVINRNKKNEATEFYRKYRPNEFKQVLGQPQAVSVLEKMLEEGCIPHALMFSGPSGTGKTTLARVLRLKMACGDADFVEINCGSEGGIDTIRKIKNRISASPISGSCRIWLLDECFHASTLISTPEGEVQINSIKPEDEVYNVAGKGTVELVFRNRVPLSRVVKLTTDDGTIVFTTCDHLFLTDMGWIEAKDLVDKACVLSKFCYSMYTTFRNFGQYEENQNGSSVSYLSKSLLPQTPEQATEDLLQEVCLPMEAKKLRYFAMEKKGITQAPEGVPCLPQNVRLFSNSEETEDLLLQKMRIQVPLQPNGTGSDRNTEMLILPKRVLEQKQFSQEVLYSDLRCQMENQPARMEDGTFLRESQDDERYKEGVLSNKGGAENKNKGLSEDEGEKSYVKPFIYREVKTNEREKGHTPYLARNPRRQWNDHKASIKAMESSEEDGPQMEERACDSNWTESGQCNEASNQLQGRHRAQEIQGSHRNRWESTQIEKEYIKRCQKDPMSRRTEVVRVEVYQRGDNDESFSGVIGDRERDQGWVEFFDLQISGHHSYFANGFPVHNCQQLSSDAQSALLKITEEAPPHAYFMLATTDPQKIKKTIHTRCTEIKTLPLKDGDIERLLNSVLEEENLDLSEELIERIIDSSEGSARKSLVLLHQVANLDTEEERLDALVKGDTKKQAIDLVRAIMFSKPNDWPKVAAIIKGLKDEEPEQIRRLVLSYATSVLLGEGQKQNGKAFYVITAFEGHFFESGRAGLVRACYEVMVSPK